MPRTVGTPWKIDLSGKQFGDWIVLKRIAGSVWLCKCKCGIEKDVSGSSLTLGKSVRCKSCATKKHGLEATKVYNTWSAMKQRCLNSNNKFYHLYGGRGITVCEEWISFEGFLKDMGIPKKGQSIGRIDNDGNYCKENCRWETQKQQIRNRSNTKYVVYNGETKSVAELAEIFGHTARNVRERLKAGWSIEEAIIKPNRKEKK